MRALAFIVGGFVVFFVAISIYGSTLPDAPAKTPDEVRADCATAPDPDGCFANAEARILAPGLHALADQQRAAEGRAAGG